MDWGFLQQLGDWRVLVPWGLGMLFGLFVGAMPGLTATMAVALVVPLSFHLPPAAGLAMILGVSFTAIFAGDIPAVLLRIPGTPASAAGTLDGYALAQQGRAGFALQLDLVCSAIGGLIGVLLLILVAPQLARFALRFSHYEYFWLALTGIGVGAAVMQGRFVRGILAAALGMLFACVGFDIVSGVPRFAFGNRELEGGIEFIPAMIGLFGLSEVFRALSLHGAAASGAPVRLTPSPWMECLRAIVRRKGTMLRSALLGTFVGALPGAGADIAAWAAYGVAQRTSPRGREFGRGEEEGVIAPTSANNAAVGGAWIPALTLGIPGDSITAIVLGALVMYDLRPGPMIFEQNPRELSTVFAIAVLTQFLLLPCGWMGIRMFGLLMRLRREYVHAGVVAFSVVGAYALRNNLFDVWVMFVFGLIGWFLEWRKIPIAPLILGMILGPMVEQNLRSGLIKSDGSLLPFLTRPLCLVMLVLLASGVALGWWWNRHPPRARD